MTVAAKPPRRDHLREDGARLAARDSRRPETAASFRQSLRPLSPHLSVAFPPPCIRGLPGVSRAECVVGNPAAAHVAVLNGDSHAEMLRNAVWRAFNPKTWSIHIFARDGCGWAGSLESGPLSAATCARLQAEALRRIRRLRPDVLLLSEHLVVAPFRSRADIASSLAAFRRAAAKTIVIGHTPLPQPWSSCLVGVDITRCFALLDATYLSDRRVEQQLAARAGATFADTSAWLCVRAGAQTVCPPVIAGVPAFKDDTHISAEYQLKLIPIVRALLRSPGWDRRPAERSRRGGRPMPTPAPVQATTLATWQAMLRAGLPSRRFRASPSRCIRISSDYVQPSCNPQLPPASSRRMRRRQPARPSCRGLDRPLHAGTFQLALLRGLGRGGGGIHLVQRGHCGWAGVSGPTSP